MIYPSESVFHWLLVKLFRFHYGEPQSMFDENTVIVSDVSTLLST